ncbi:hypothetical protein [Natrialba chahannaoensis]|nr:hypothetical protein [Natrialba chahannaoensis]
MNGDSDRGTGATESDYDAVFQPPKSVISKHEPIREKQAYFG